MEPLAVIDIARESLYVLLKLALPLLMVALFVGLAVSLLQALTQIQEPTLAFVPKIIAVFVTILFLLPYMGHVMGAFSEDLISTIIQLE